MSEGATTDICVIGAGDGALTLATGAAQMGARVVLAVGDAALELAVADRCRGLGIEVLGGAAAFESPERIRLGGRVIAARRYVIAVGTRRLPPILPGLDQVAQALVLPVDGAPPHLAVIGGDAAEVALAQSCLRRGGKVTLIEPARLLPQADPDLVAVLRRALVSAGADLREGSSVSEVVPAADGVAVTVVDNQGTRESVMATHLLLKAASVPDIAALGLDRAGIAVTRDAVVVDRRLRTSNRRVYAIGAAIGAGDAVPLANHHAGIVLRNILFRLPAKTDPDLVPNLALTEPPLAAIGLSESAAKARYRDVRVQQLAFSAETAIPVSGPRDGIIKVVLRGNGEILGVGIVGPQAGELLAPWCLALSRRLRLSAMAGVLLPHPTLSEISKRLAGDFYAARLQGEGVRAIVRGLLRFA